MMAAAKDESRMILRAAHHVPYRDPDNFGIIAPDSIMGLWKQLTGNIFAIAVWLTTVFLLIGGIVIMNIMLASVTERTREIGIRKALGARRRHIVLQFLLESATLSVVGGVLGLALALTITLLVRELHVRADLPQRRIGCDGARAFQQRRTVFRYLSRRESVAAGSDRGASRGKLSRTR